MTSVLSQQQKDAVKSSWAQYRSNGIANGIAFYQSWFKAYPYVLPYFKPLFQDLSVSDMNESPKIKAQIMVFNDALASFIDYLDDVDVLTVLVQKLANNHAARGLTVNEFQDAYGHFVSWLQGKFHLDDDTKDAWEKTVAIICEIMAEHM